MTKHLADLDEAAALPAASLRRCGVPKPVRADRLDPGAKRCSFHDGRDARRVERALRRAQAHEDRRRVMPLGRPRVSQTVIASPTSTGSGSLSRRAPLPRTTSSPLRQSMSSRSSRATSPARSPSREQQSQDREVPTAYPSAPITASEKTRQFGRLRCFGAGRPATSSRPTAPLGRATSLSCPFDAGTAARPGRRSPWCSPNRFPDGRIPL